MISGKKKLRHTCRSSTYQRVIFSLRTPLFLCKKVSAAMKNTYDERIKMTFIITELMHNPDSFETRSFFLASRPFVLPTEQNGETC